MATFKYTGKTIDNKRVKGVTEAADETVFLSRSRSEGIFLTSYQCVDEGARRVYHLKSPEVSDFSRQVSNMLSSGIPIFRAMGIMRDSEPRAKIKAVYEFLYRTIQEGNTLATAMEITGGSFPPLIINMFRAGEASGQLDKTALKMADYYDKEHKLYNKVKNAMTYPIFLLVVTFGVVMLIFTVILPNFFDLFANMDLPQVTEIMLRISEFMQAYWYWVIIAVLILVAGTAAVLRIPAVAFKADALRLSLPIVGKLLTVIYTARFARTLSSLYSSGLTMLDAIRISSSIIGNRFVSSQFDEVTRRIRNGEALSASLSGTRGFSGKLYSTIMIGEETGKLDDMLSSMAEAFDFEAENATARLVALIEPMMIVIMAFVIGSIMVSVMLPIFNLYQSGAIE